MDNTLNARIDNVLLSRGIITKEIYDDVLREFVQTNVPIETILLKRGVVSEDQLASIKGETLGIEFIDPSSIDIHPDIINMLPVDLAKKYLIVPFNSTAEELSLAMVDPLDLEVIGYLERSLNKKIKPYISSATLINKSIEKEYSHNIGKEVTAAVEEVGGNEQKIEESLNTGANVNEIIKVSPVAQIVNIILEYAVKSGASDIHIEPFETGTRIRFRIDGVLQEKFPIPKAVQNALVARIKILATMPIDEHRKPLDGRFKVTFGQTKTDLRVSSIPTIYGEKVVIRLLKDQKQTFTLSELGLWGRPLEIYEKGLSQTTGIMLVTGPTGSGKTVTQATALQKLNKITTNIITVEDPVEIGVQGVNQVQVNVKAGLTFAAALRSILRQDPNVIMVGEIRDSETAQLAIQAALTGHLVLATLHTNSAPGAIPRLIDMGIEKFLLSSTINVSLAQRLVRKVCKHCKAPYEANEEIVANLRRVLGEDLFKLGLGLSPFATKEEEAQFQQTQAQIQAQTIAQQAQAQPQIQTIPLQQPLTQTVFDPQTGQYVQQIIQSPNQSVQQIIQPQPATSSIAPQYAQNNNTNQIQAPLQPAVSQNIITEPKVILWQGKGCDKCNGKGYSGRIGIYEVMEIGEDIQKLTLKGASTAEITEAAIKNKMITLVQDGYLKAMWGITTMQEVLTEADE